MIIIPAIDLKAGKVVRIRQGNLDDIKIHSDDPIETAMLWEKEGAEYLHLVDLDGAFEGKSKNLHVIRMIREAVAIPIEMGGGLRSLKSIDGAFAFGVNRVILGTAVLNDPELIKQAIKKYGSEQILAGIDAKDGFISDHRIPHAKPIPAVQLANQMKTLGVSRIAYIDLTKKGTSKKINIEEMKKLIVQTGLKVTVAGGVSQLEDVRNLKSLESLGVDSIVVGDAFYEERFTLQEAKSV
jgi:phosphoribosylformimino-5-aminoimidazole carboxamide ribotide isomerase